MASDASFAQFVVDQINGAGTITIRFMFGEFAVYCNEKVVALICDNKLYVKPTEAGRAYIGTPVEAPAYTGAKPSFLIEDQLEDAKWLTELIRITEREVDAPKAKKQKSATKVAATAVAVPPKSRNTTTAKAKPKAKAKANPKAKPKAKAAITARPKTKPKPTKKPSGRSAQPKARAQAAKKAAKTPAKKPSKKPSKK